MNIESLIGRFFRRKYRQLMRFPGTQADIGLPAPANDRRYLAYLHIPFCVVLCPFCSFHRVEFKEDRATRYFAALQDEVRLATEAGYQLSDLYIGGGTPTVLPQQLIETIELTRSLHTIDSVSVETNPHDLDRNSLLRMRDAGVTRLSVGVQSFDDQLLREMHRYDKYGSGQDIRAHLQQVGGIFDTLNVDMIFNFPHQSDASLAKDLNILTNELAADQISFYPLMNADTTQRLMRRELGDASQDRERHYYDMIVQRLLDAGYVRSSAWCFSRVPSMLDEYIVTHEEYLGLGSGSFSYLNGSMYANTFSINNYFRLVANGKTSCVRQRTMTRREQMRYHLLMRLFSGRLDTDESEKQFAGRFQKHMRRELAGLRLIGAIEKRGTTIRLTSEGYYLWVVMMQEFFSGVNNFRDDMRQHIPAERSTLPPR